MLVSLLLCLTPTQPAILDGFYGRQVQGWLLRRIRSHDPALADRLHAANGLRPYTVSSLIVPQAGPRDAQGRLSVAPGTVCQIRLTSVDTSLSELLLKTIKPRPPALIQLTGIEFRVLRLSEENGWDGQTTFEEIVEQAAAAQQESITLHFASPTAFRSEGIDLTLPTADQVWRSLWWRWNNFAPEELRIDPSWPEFAARCLVVSDFQLRSLKITFKNGLRGAATGATGQATYRLLPEKHCGAYAPYRSGADRVLRTLAAFALYSGVGHHTTIGLGQTRRLPHSNGPTSDSGEPDEY